MKNTIYGIIIGILITIVGYCTFVVISLQGVVASDHAVLGKIVEMINASQKQQQVQSPQK